jgi:Zn-dependent M16 (insulinase) family peptidase
MGGLAQEQVAGARALLRATLERIADEGVPLATLQAALRDIAYNQRDTSGGRMPNVLARLLNAVPVVMRDGDTIGAFDSAGALARLRQDILDPDFFRGLVRSLLDNPARLDADVVPDPDYFTRRAALEQERLDAILPTLTPEARQRVADDNAALEALQRQPADSALLPRIRPGDVSAQPRALPPVRAAAEGKYLFGTASNGISYARIQYELGSLPEDDWPWLQLYADLRGELGVADLDYEQAGAWCRSQVPRFGLGVDAALDAGGALRLTLNFLASGLREEHAHIAAVLDAYIDRPRFDEHARIRFLIERMARRRLDGLAQDADRYAALAAAAPLSPLRRFENASGGADAVRFLDTLQRSAASPDGIVQIAARLARLHERIAACPSTILCAGSGDDAHALGALFDAPAAHADGAGTPPPGQSPLAKHALYAASQVNHCHIAWPAPNQLHPDAPALAVAAELMSHQLLHQALREQGGAYGGHAAYVESAGIFTMSSYRDPRLAGTYADFAATVDRVLEAEFRDEQLEEAVICVIKKLDHPASPFEAVLGAWTLHRRGIDLAARQRFRSGVLACTAADVKAAVRRWLKGVAPSRAAAVGNTDQALDGLQVVDLLSLSQPSRAAV